MSRIFGTFLFCLMLSCVGASTASSRAWKATPEALARDYATILDTRAQGELVVLAWFAPALVPQSAPGAANVSAMLEKYVVLMITHAHLEMPTGKMSFDDIDTLEARDQSQRPLGLVTRDALPPATAGAVTTLEALFRQSFGAMGSGMKTFVFDAGTVHSCQKGELSVPYGGETYTWETPFPGCPQN